MADKPEKQLPQVAFCDKTPVQGDALGSGKGSDYGWGTVPGTNPVADAEAEQNAINNAQANAQAIADAVTCVGGCSSALFDWKRHATISPGAVLPNSTKGRGAQWGGWIFVWWTWNSTSTATAHYEVTCTCE